MLIPVLAQVLVQSSCAAGFSKPKQTQAMMKHSSAMTLYASLQKEHYKQTQAMMERSSASIACILAEGAIALSVTLSGGALFAS